MRKSVQIAAAIAAAGSLQIVGGIARAQSQTGAADEPKVEGAELETVTVTGSLIPTEPNSVAVGEKSCSSAIVAALINFIVIDGVRKTAIFS